MKTLFLIFLFSTIVYSQSNFWQPMHGPYANNFGKFLETNGRIYSGSKGILVSDDHGKSWDLIRGETEKYNITKIVVDNNNNIYADAFVYIYKSTDNGVSWERLQKLEKYTHLIGIIKDSLLLLQDKEMRTLISHDGGLTFLPSNLKINDALTSNDNNLLVACKDSRRCYISTNNGEDWEVRSLKMNLSNPTIISTCISSKGDIYLGSHNNGIFSSSDSGKTWKHIGLNGFRINSIFLDNDNNIYAAADTSYILSTDRVYKGLFKFNKFTKSWSLLNLTNSTVLDVFHIGNSNFLVSVSGRGVFLFNPTKKLWEQITSGLLNPNISSITLDNNDYIFVTTYQNGIFRLRTYQHWEQINNGLTDNLVYQAAIGNPDYIYLASWNGGVFKSKDLGNSWEPTKTRPDCITTKIASLNDSLIIVGSNSSGIYRSQNGGITWTQSGLTGCEISDIILISHSELLVGSLGITEYYAREIIETDSSKGVFFSSDTGNTWTLLGLDKKNVTAIGITDNKIIFAGTNSSLYKSTDFGNTWERLCLAEGKTDITSITCYSSNYVFIGTFNKGAFYSTNQGKSWNSLNYGLKNKKIVDIKISNTKEIIMASKYHGVYKANLNSLVK